MVLMGYWTDNRIRSLLSRTSEMPSADITAKSRDDIYEVFTNADAMLTSTYSEVVYDKLNLVKVVNRDGTDLTPKQ